MNTQATQFYIAMVAVVGLVILTGLVIICIAFGNAANQVLENVLLLLIGGLVSSASCCVAYLFRLNGKATVK